MLPIAKSSYSRLTPLIQVFSTFILSPQLFLIVTICLVAAPFILVITAWQLQTSIQPF